MINNFLNSIEPAVPSTYESFYIDANNNFFQNVCDVYVTVQTSST